IGIAIGVLPQQFHVGHVIHPLSSVHGWGNSANKVSLNSRRRSNRDHCVHVCSREYLPLR
ncbi:MAG: hypothetical protein ACXWJX_12340, partial [Limisphaerales bacterium]